MLLILGSCHGNSSNPADHLSKEKMGDVMREIVHYAAKLAPGATHDTKFEEQYDLYYQGVAAEYKWMHIRSTQNNGYYFLISRPAKSLTPMAEGIGGTFFMKDDSLVAYEETFRMWKMSEENLQVKGKALFDRMVGGKDLSIYYSKFAGDEYIEFPDDRFVYDKEKRVWLDTARPQGN
jgi:hypothetical protein